MRSTVARQISTITYTATMDVMNEPRVAISVPRQIHEDIVLLQGQEIIRFRELLQTSEVSAFAILSRYVATLNLSMTNSPVSSLSDTITKN